MTAQNVSSSGIPVLSGTAFSKPSSAVTTTTTSVDILVGEYRALAVDVNISAVSGTSPSYTLSINRKGSDGIYYSIYTGGAQTAVGKVSLNIGPGLPTNVIFGNTIQLVETIAGTSPSITRSVSIIGR